MAQKVNKRVDKRAEKQPRRNRVVIMLNDSELKTLTRYCRRYQIHNRSHLIRQTLMRSIVKKMSDDMPTLFD